MKSVLTVGVPEVLRNFVSLALEINVYTLSDISKYFGAIVSMGEMGNHLVDPQVVCRRLLESWKSWYLTKYIRPSGMQ